MVIWKLNAINLVFDVLTVLPQAGVCNTVQTLSKATNAENKRRLAKPRNALKC